MDTDKINKTKVAIVTGSSSGIGFETIVNLTPAYVSSKFALEGLSEYIAYELEQFGIKIILRARCN